MDETIRLRKQVEELEDKVGKLEAIIYKIVIYAGLDPSILETDNKEGENND